MATTNLFKFLIVASVITVVVFGLYGFTYYKSNAKEPKTVINSNVELFEGDAEIASSFEYVDEFASDEATIIDNRLNNAGKTDSLLSEDEVKEIFEEFGTAYKTIFSSAKDQGKKVVNKINTAVKTVASSAKDQGKKVVNKINTVVSSVKDKGKNVKNKIKNVKLLSRSQRKKGKLF